MSEIIRAILVMSVSGSLLALLLFAMKPLVKNRLPKSAQYYLWLVVIAALLLPVSRLVVLPESKTPIPSISETIDRYVVNAAEVTERLRAFEVKSPDGSIGMLISDAADIETLVLDSRITELMDICAWLYPLGVILVLAFYLYAYSAFVIKLKRTNIITDIDCPLPVYRNAKATTPMLIGLFKPVIVLPDCEYMDAQLRAVLLHELTHLRRKDVLVKWLSLLACAVHWFNPIVWLSRREINRTCELACDAEVIRGLDAEGKQNYGDTLIRVAAESKTSHAVISTTMCEEKKTLKERLEAIMKNKKHTCIALIASVVLIVAVSSAAIALGAGRGIGTIDDIINNNEPHFSGVVTEVYEKSILVKANDDEDVRASSDLLNVPLNTVRKDSQQSFTIGDEVMVYYDGAIAEIYPAQIRKVYAILLINPAKNDNKTDANNEAIIRYAIYEPTAPFGTGDGALLDGILRQRNGCIVVEIKNGSEADGSEVLPIFPANVTAWDEAKNALILNGKEYPIGRQISFGGGYTSNINEDYTIPESYGQPVEAFIVSNHGLPSDNATETQQGSPEQSSVEMRVLQALADEYNKAAEWDIESNTIVVTVFANGDVLSFERLREYEIVANAVAGGIQVVIEADSASPPHSLPHDRDLNEIKAIYLAPKGGGQISAQEIESHPEILVVNNFGDLKKAFQPQYAIWIDKDAIAITDQTWLREEPQMNNPLVLVGFNNGLFSFRDTLGLNIEGPYVDWSEEVLEPGFSVWMLLEATKPSTTSSYMQGYSEIPSVDRIFAVTDMLLGGKLPE